MARKAVKLRKPKGDGSTTSTRTAGSPSAMIDSSRIYPAEADPSIWGTLDVEIILVIHMAATIMTHLALQDYFLEACCRIDLGFSNRTCMALKTE